MIEPLLIKALEADQPLVELREVIRGLLDHGRSRQDVKAELESLRTYLTERGRDQDEDVVLDVLDFVVGWCSPHMKI